MARGTCRVCGCTDEYGCPEGCEWIEPDLCSACEDTPGAIATARSKRKRCLRLETASTVFDKGHREVVVEFTPANPELITLRLKGRRVSYPVEASQLFRWALEADRARRKRERAAARKVRR